MSNFKFPVAASFCLVPVLLCTAWADQITLKNGDRVTGSIVKKDGGKITIKTDHFGTITTDWDQVQSVTAEKPVTVVLQDGRTVQGTVATSGANLEVVTPSGRVSATPAQIHGDPRRRRADSVRAAAESGMGRSLGRHRQFGICGHQRQLQNFDFHGGSQCGAGNEHG